MACQNPRIQPTSFVPVCASVICEAPGVIYVSIDPEVWKIRCRQCQEKTEHKCALKKLKAKFRPSFLSKKKDSDKKGDSKNQKKGDGEKDEEREEEDEEEEEEEKDEEEENDLKGQESAKSSKSGKKKLVIEESKADEDTQNKGSELLPPPQIPDNYCACADRPMDVVPRPNVCSCEIYKPLNFMFELEVTGEYKPAYVPKARKQGKE